MQSNPSVPLAALARLYFRTATRRELPEGWAYEPARAERVSARGPGGWVAIEQTPAGTLVVRGRGHVDGNWPAPDPAGAVDRFYERVGAMAQVPAIDARTALAFVEARERGRFVAEGQSPVRAGELRLMGAVQHADNTITVSARDFHGRELWVRVGRRHHAAFEVARGRGLAEGTPAGTRVRTNDAFASAPGVSLDWPLPNPASSGPWVTAASGAASGAVHVHASEEAARVHYGHLRAFGGPTHIGIGRLGDITPEHARALFADAWRVPESAFTLHDWRGVDTPGSEPTSPVARQNPCGCTRENPCTYEATPARIYGLLGLEEASADDTPVTLSWDGRALTAGYAGETPVQLDADTPVGRTLLHAYFGVLGQNSLTGMIEPTAERVNGVYDPGILKAVFLAGGPGSGKSYLAQGLFGLPRGHVFAITAATGLKLVNSDPAFELYLRRSGIDPRSLGSMTPAQFAAVTEGADSPREQAKRVRDARLVRWEEGRLGLIIDGTGDDYAKLSKKREHYIALGYDTFMVFVNTTLEKALERNRKRARVLPEPMVRAIWQDVQVNLGHFQRLFEERRFVVIDNTEDNQQFLQERKAVAGFLRRPIENERGRAWVAEQLRLHAHPSVRAPAQPNLRRNHHLPAGTPVAHGIYGEGTVAEMLPNDRYRVSFAQGTLDVDGGDLERVNPVGRLPGCG